MKSRMILGVALLALVMSSSAFAGTITLWDYNAGTLAPSIGSGTMTEVGNITKGKADKIDTSAGDYGAVHANGQIDGKVINGNVENGSTDPVVGNRMEWNKNWLTTDAPGVDMVRWNVSTVGYDNINVALDVRIKPYDAKYFSLWYTTDGWQTKQAWNTWQAIDAGGDMTLWNDIRVDFSGVAGVANNAGFGFGFASAYGPGKNAYEFAASNFSENSNFKYGFDMAEVFSGTSDVTRVANPFGAAPVIPEPGSLLALGTGLFGLVGLVVRRRTH